MFYLLIAMLSFPLLAKVEIQIYHSEPASFLHFLDSGFNAPHTSDSVRELIKNEGIFQDAHVIEDYNTYKSYLNLGYNFSDEAPNRPEGFYADDGLDVLAANSPNLATFESQLSLLLPYRGVNLYQKLKKDFYPIFLKTLWTPSLPKQDAQLKEIIKEMEKSDFKAWIDIAKAFYRSDYPEELPFKIALVPIPETGGNHTSARSLRDVQIVPYLQKVGAVKNLDVVFHEFCHALYQGQSLAIKKEIDEFYLNSKHTHAYFAYNYLNEMLATAWGNGWFAEILDGKVAERSWYDDKFIDGYAKAMFPFLKEHVKAKKPFNHSFMEKTLEVAKKQFPDAHRDVASNLFKVSVWVPTEQMSRPYFHKELRNRFSISSFNYKAPMEKSDWHDFHQSGLINPILISSNQAVIRKIPKLWKHQLQDLVKNKSTFLAILPFEKNFLFWFNVDSEADYIRLLDKLKNLPLLPEKAQIYE